jgi:hypothetical protein
MLQAHSQIQGIDETEFHSPYPFPHSLDLLKYRWQDRRVCLKLPMHVNKLDYITRYFPNSKIVWTIRHPENVIASMCALKNVEGNWIQRCGREELLRLSGLFQEIRDLDLDRLSDTALATYIWHYKAQAVELFKARNLNVFELRYESLLENPKQVMGELLQFLELPWEDRVLNFDRFHESGRTYAGQTKGNQPLDPKRRKPKLQLSETDITTIESIGRASMEKYDYSFNR